MRNGIAIIIVIAFLLWNIDKVNAQCPTAVYSLCFSDSYTLTSQSGLTNIQWQKDNGSGYTNISGATSSSLVVNQIGKYKYIAQDANGCTIEQCCAYEVIAGTNCCPSLQTYSLCAGGSYTLAAQSGLTSIQWKKDSGSGYTNILGATSSSLVVTEIGKYKYVAQDANGCTIEQCCAYEVIAGTNCCPSLQTYSLCAGESYTLAAQSGLVNIQWQKDGSSGYTNILGATSSSLVVTEIGKYKYVAQDANGCTIEQCCAYEVIVGTNCCPTLQSYSLCVGESYTLTAQSGLVNIQWQKDSGSGYTNILGATGSSLVVTEIGKYKYFAQDANGCTIEQCCAYEVVAGTNCCPTLQTYSLCAGESYTLTAQSGLTNIQWYKDNGSGYTPILGEIGNTYIVTSVGKYKYTAKDANYCVVELCCPFDIIGCCKDTVYTACEGEKMTLTAQNGLTNIRWQKEENGIYVDIAGATNITYEVTTSGKYKYVAQDANSCLIELCCPFNIYFLTKPTFELQAINVCKGEPEDVKIVVTSTALITEIKYDNGNFQPYPSNSLVTWFPVGTYSITLKNKYGCTASRMVTVANNLPKVCLGVKVIRK